MYSLNALELPLYGTSLIEASAGTGKTYTLIIIYLRLLLCLGNKSDFARPLTIKEILVVTFTKSLAQELRSRIRENIRQFRLDCMRGYSNNSLFSKLLLQIQNVDLAINQLYEAEKKIDQASIFTIHSFCQNILNHHTIELNMLFNTNIIENETKLYQQVCADFWRRNFYSLPLNIACLIQEYWKDPCALLNDIFPYIYKFNSNEDHYNIYEGKKNIIAYYEQILTYIKSVKKKWNRNNYNIITTINSYDTNHRIYNQKNLIRWINKVNQWATQTTIDHAMPNDLRRFRLTELKIHNKNEPDCMYCLFNAIEELYKKFSSFKTLIFNLAIYEVYTDLHNTQHVRSEITFNDLVDVLLLNLVQQNKENKLTHTIRTSYPVTIFDEFQDTDQQQFKIFHTLYNNCSDNGLILIGDPKQSIYAFRGADVFSYMKIRQTISNKYNLNINWRSSSNMVNAVNQLFQFVPNPFIFENISFIPAIAANGNNMYRFFVNNKLQTAMCFWLHPDEIVTIDDYKETMAKECAAIIHNLLHEIRNGKAWLEDAKNKRKLDISDITILVRNHEEASLIRSVLSKINIPTVFLSNQKDIFETIESYELSLLLRAILFPERHTICTALTTVFFGLNATDIENINNNESKWEQIFEEFFEYYSIWKKQGVYLMIQKIIFHHKIPEKLLSIQGGEIILINILHLSELLQNITKQLQNEHALMEWLISKITQTKNKTVSNQILRFSDDSKLIKISTIHKSKGLEFPLTFLPFLAADFNCKKNSFFHDRKSYQTYLLDYNASKFNSILADEERLSEDLRLLYVAVTRSIYHCSIGIGPIVSRYKKSNVSDLHHSALGYLIQKKTAGNAETLKKNLKNLSIYSNGDISFRIIPQSRKLFPYISPPTISSQCLSARKWKKSLNTTPWSITSFSTLKYNNTTICLDLQKTLDISQYLQCQENDISLTSHTFPKGKIYGSFFHSIFEVLDFRKIIDIKWLYMYMEKYDIDPIWGFTIQEWIYIVLNTPLNKENLTLAQITPENKKTEFKFYLPINTYLTSQELDSLCKYYDPLSHRSSSLTFLETKGMLQGFIDLVFRWNNRYYLLDYKTNWLGKNNDAYIISRIEQEMIKHRYELQYQLYALALHRFLRNRLISYNYEKNFGGIYYLFIRGMDGTPFSNGIYFSRPLLKFIEKLDNLFSGK